MDRITYSREFQVRCMAQYLRGNGPTSIFASAGLNPKIVGSKRIERAIARWKADPQIMTEAQSFANEAAADQRDLLVFSAGQLEVFDGLVVDIFECFHAFFFAGDGMEVGEPGCIATLICCFELKG